MFEAPRQIKSAAAARSGAVAGGQPPLADIDLRRSVLLLWRGKTTIFLTTTVSLLLTVVLVAVVPHRYTATTQILIDPVDLHAVANAPIPASQISDAAVLQVESQVRVLTSDSVLRRVVKAQRLDHDPEFVGRPSALHLLLAAFGLAGQTRGTADPTVAALTAFRRAIVVRRAERTYVVDVSVKSRDPEKAARLANAIAQAYLAEQTAVRSDAARQVSQSLSAQLNQLKSSLRAAEDRVEAYKARHNIIDAGGQLVDEQQLSELNNQLILARARVAQARARYEEVERLQQAKGEIGAFPAAVQSQTITALRSQYAEIMRREAEQMAALGPRHPAVIDIEAQAARLKTMIEDEVNRIAISARTEYDSARGDEATLQRNLEALKQKAIATNAALVTLRELQREAQAGRAVYEAFLVRARETGEEERLDTKNIRVISRADLPLHRSFPPSNLALAAAAVMFGAAVGAGIVLMRAPAGEAAPRPRPTRDFRRRGAGNNARFGAAPAAAVPVLAVLPAVDIAFGVEAAGMPTSAFAAEIGKVHKAVRASHHKRGNPSVLVIAPDDEDDTAAVAVGLAAAAAVNQRVLLIDTDIERRTLSAVNAEESEAGLVDVAVGRRRLSDAVVRDRQSKINLLPFVSLHSRRDREIDDEDIREAFAQTKKFDMVIVAAMDCDHDPSGRFFAGLVDHIVLVARADEVDNGSIAEFAARFGLDARKVRGTVLTQARAA